MEAKEEKNLTQDVASEFLDQAMAWQVELGKHSGCDSLSF